MNESFSVRSNQWRIETESLLFSQHKLMEQSYSLKDRYSAHSFGRVKTLPSSSARSCNSCRPRRGGNEFIWLHFVDNLPPGYTFMKTNLQGSKEPLTCIVLEDVLRSRCNVQSDGIQGG